MAETAKDKGETRAGNIRTFICIEIPETIKQKIAALQRGLRQIDAKISWVNPDNAHLSLKFLGDVPSRRMAAVCAAVERAASSSSPFQIEVAGAGCFPSPRSPRVLWVGLADVPDQLHRLQRTIEDELAREGFAREPKRFSPHLTIGRVRSPHGGARVAEALIASGFAPQSFHAAEVIVMRSDLNPTGSVYTPQAILGLAN